MNFLGRFYLIRSAGLHIQMMDCVCAWLPPDPERGRGRARIEGRVVAGGRRKRAFEGRDGTDSRGRGRRRRKSWSQGVWRFGPVELVTRYAQRMLIENGISEAVQFFHIDALSSMVGMKVDFDMQLTLAASSLYRMMAQRIGREYRHSQAKTLFRNLLDLSGTVEVTATSVVVTLDKRAHNPYLVASGLADQPTPMPWFGDKKLIIQFA